LTVVVVKKTEIFRFTFNLRNLSNTLKAKTLLMINYTVNSSSEPNVSCLSLLLLWDRTAGRGESFQMIAVRLRQLGRADVANQLSKSVYGEKDGAVEDAFFNSPFKAATNIDSPLLINAPQTLNDDRQPKPEQKTWTGIITWISLQWPKLTKPVCLTDVICAFLKNIRGILRYSLKFNLQLYMV